MPDSAISVNTPGNKLASDIKPELTAVPNTFNGVQALRGLAACMVVAFHSAQQWWPNGAAGVDIFFVISGFVMAVSSLDRREGPVAARNFFERRLVRVLPLYWIITTFLWFRLRFPHAEISLMQQIECRSIPYLVSSYLLVPYRGALGEASPLLRPGWTLSYEMFFYLCFSLALLYRGRVIHVLTIMLLAFVALGYFRTPAWPVATTLLNPLLLEFLAGVWLGHAARRGHLRGKYGLRACAIAVLVALVVLPAPGSWSLQRLYWGLGGCILVAACAGVNATNGRSIPKAVLLLGDASYSLYLSHYLLLGVEARILTRAHVLTPGTVKSRDEIVAIAVGLAVSITVALAIYFLIERPLNQTMRRKLHLRRMKTATD